MRILILFVLLASCERVTPRMCRDQAAVHAALDACTKAGAAAAASSPCSTHASCLKWAEQVACEPVAAGPDGGTP